MTGSTEDFDWIVFDLGGVLIELDGPPISPAASALDEAEIWNTWIKSDAVRRYESGRCDRSEFANRLIEEFQLTCSEQSLIDMFLNWPLGFYPEVSQMIRALKGKAKLACLSNTNELHWQRFSSESEVFHHFDQVFLSFQMGIMKPDQEIFATAESVMAAPPERILYLDDNESIVEAARRCGWQAHRSKGISEVTGTLKKHNLL